jgi:hypothetical protein
LYASKPSSSTKPQRSRAYQPMPHPCTFTGWFRRWFTSHPGVYPAPCADETETGAGGERAGEASTGVKGGQPRARETAGRVPRRGEGGETGRAGARGRWTGPEVALRCGWSFRWNFGRLSRRAVARAYLGHRGEAMRGAEDELRYADLLAVVEDPAAHGARTARAPSDEGAPCSERSRYASRASLKIERRFRGQKAPRRMAIRRVEEN